jgi:hypothetical protein
VSSVHELVEALHSGEYHPVTVEQTLAEGRQA